MRPHRLRAVARRGAAASEAAMLDGCVVSRPARGDVTIDPATAKATPAEPDTIYADRCRLRLPGDSSASPTTPQTPSIDITQFRLKVPADAGPFEIGDVVTITATQRPDLLPLVAGRRWAVRTVGYSTWGVHQVLAVEEVSDRG